MNKLHIHACSDLHNNLFIRQPDLERHSSLDSITLGLLRVATERRNTTQLGKLDRQEANGSQPLICDYSGLEELMVEPPCSIVVEFKDIILKARGPTRERDISFISG